MAVDSKLGETKLGVGAVPQTTAQQVANAAATAEGSGLKRAKRTSSLMRSASALPKVEHSLDEFIARANQTLVDVSQWGTADQQAKEQEEKRREQDALRWKQAETQMKEGDAREQSLRRQLDGLQGKLAEAEARAAVAMSASSSGGMSAAAVAAHDASLSDLRLQIEAAHNKMKASEQQTADLAKQLELAKTQAAARTAVDVPVSFDRSGDGYRHDDGETEARIKLAEAKAAKALAAARAAAAGLTVSSADLAAIESGLVVPQPIKRGTPWIAIMLAFGGGLAIMFVIWKFALSGGDKPKAVEPTAPAAAPAAQQQAVPPAPAAPAKPTVTPIEDSPTPVPAAATEDKPDVKPTVEPIEVEPPTKAEPEPVKPAIKEPAPVVEVKKAAPAPRPAIKKAPAAPAIKKAPAPAAKAVTPAPATKKAPASKVVDPFADPPAAPKKPAAPAPKKQDKPAVVDPFS